MCYRDRDLASYFFSNDSFGSVIFISHLLHLNELKMARTGSYSAAIVLIVSNFLLTRANDSILGCGGFVKSHADIDFSKVEVKL